jgi:signal transduction histidine kinase
MGLSKFMNEKTSHSPLRGMSIQQRLPLLICVLLLSVILAFSWVSYIGVKKAALKSGRERLNTLTDQLGTMFSQSMQSAVALTRTAANQPSIKKCLTELEPQVCTEAMAAMDKLRQDSSSVLVDLLDINRRHILRSGKNQIETKVDFDAMLPATLDTGSVGKILVARDSMYYPMIVGILHNEKIAGYLVRWRLLTTTPQAVAQFSQLLGTKATLYLGNVDKSLWTDLLKPIPNPVPANSIADDNVYTYSHGKGNGVLATEKQVKNTPWSLLIEFSQEQVLETANKFLIWIIIIGSVLVAIGSFIAWIMSRNITRPLNKLTAAVTAIAAGNERQTVDIERRDEVGKLARAFNAMSLEVHNGKQALEQKVLEAEQMSSQLRDLSAHLQNIREQERIHIAREMHDELGQLLTGFKMDTAWLSKKLSANEDPAVKEKLESLLQIVDEAVSFVRRIAAELRPSVLDDLGLVAALEWQSKEFQKRFNIEVEFNSKVEDLQTSGIIATGLFRMYQESLTNVARHSGANKVISNLQKTPKQICLSITDDGKGFSMNGSGERKTLGLLGMKERAVMIGGKLEIISEPGKGTTVLITVPERELIASQV